MMTIKRWMPTIIFTLLLGTGYAQSYSSQTIQYDGETRAYDIYVPAAYDGTAAVPLMFNFHGGSGDIASQIAIADMSSIADTASFIVVYPQALPDPNDGGSTNWIHKDPTTVDDVFFIDALIDALLENYQIDTDKIYACGYSLGGEFTYELACRLNNRIAAVGVVARTMQTWTFENCSPEHPTGILSILGTADPISDYNGVWWGGIQYYLSAEEVHNYWSAYNNCNNLPVVTSLPNTSSSDGSTVEQHTWATADNCIYVEHLKVINGGHDWPGSFGNMDIDATREIWQFVSRYDLNGLMACTSTGLQENNPAVFQYNVYPNPFDNFLTIATDNAANKSFELYTSSGEFIRTENVTKHTIDLSALPPGMYFLKIENQLKKIIKQK